MNRTWNWGELPAGTQDGLRRADPKSLSPFSDWLQRQIVDRARYQDYADLAQKLCAALLFRTSSAAGREKLRHDAAILEAYLQKLTLRLMKDTCRSKTRYEKTLTGFHSKRLVPGPAEGLEAAEAEAPLLRAVAKLDGITRQVVLLKRDGSTHREIAQKLWPHQKLGAAMARVKMHLQRARRGLELLMSRLKGR